MKNILFYLVLFISASITAQSSFTENDAKQLVDTFFEGFHKGDTLMMRSTLAKKVQLQTAFSTKEGEAKISDGSIDNLIAAIGKRPADQQWDERLLDYKVSVDGNLAHVWTPYEFWVNGTFSHCGANAFTIAKTNDGWRIIHLIDSRRRESCGK